MLRAVCGAVWARRLERFPGTGAPVRCSSLPPIGAGGQPRSGLVITSGQTNPTTRNVKPLEESLDKLRAEIRALDLDDEARRQRLEGLVREIEQTLADPGDKAGAGTLGDQLKASVLSFEASHPRLAGVMNDVAEKLSHMGI
jgi:hypothetical protein